MLAAVMRMFPLATLTNMQETTVLILATATAIELPTDGRAICSLGKLALGRRGGILILVFPLPPPLRGRPGPSPSVGGGGTLLAAQPVSLVFREKGMTK